MSRPAPSQRRSDVWSYALPTRWGDMDMLGHVNNARYFVYSESARLAFFEHVFGADQPLFVPGGQAGTGPILAEIGCTYHAQLHHPATLDIEVRITRLGERSLDLHTPMFRRGEERAVADVRAVLVWFDYAAQRAALVPEILRPYLVE